MVKFLLVTIIISLLSTSISAQVEKEAIAEKSISSGSNSIQPVNLKSLTFLQDRENEILYRPNPSSIKDEIIINCKCSFKREVPVILINGEIYSSSINNIDPKEIKSITILRDQPSNDVKGQIKGVILIKTKKAKKSIDKRKALVIINGIASKKGVETINPKTVKSITVLQDQASKDHYGKAGENGIILVTTID